MATTAPKEHHHGDAICRSSGMVMVFIATSLQQPCCDGLAKGADVGFYLIMSISWEKLISKLTDFILLNHPQNNGIVLP